MAGLVSAFSSPMVRVSLWRPGMWFLQQVGVPTAGPGDQGLGTF